MAQDQFQRVIPLLLDHEGGYTNNPKDNGNWSTGKAGRGRLIGTKYGISAPVLLARTPDAMAKDMQALTQDVAAEIYRAQYWDTIRGDDLPLGLDYAAFDYAVNSGPARAAKDLQRCLGVQADGVIGPQTLAAIHAADAGAVITDLCARRLAFMKSLKGWAAFGKGWARRVREVQHMAKAMHAVISADYAPAAPILTPPARPEDKSALKAFQSLEGLAPVITGLGSLSALFAGTGPVQWALAGGLLLAACVGAWLVVKHTRAAI